MKTVQNIFLVVGAFVSGIHYSYGNEKIAVLKSMQQTSFPAKGMQKDSIALLEEQRELISTLLAQQEAFELKYFVLIGIVLFLILLFGMLCFWNKRGNKRLEKIVSLLEKDQTNDVNEEKETTHKKLDIDPVIIDAILENLKAFENEKGFLNTKITLHSFAKKLKTNTKYLSRVINTYKLKSFRHYINDLRVDYSIERIENNRNYRNYTVHAMAKEAGFGNRESFSKAFQKKTGKTVSTFLKIYSIK